MEEVQPAAPAAPEPAAIASEPATIETTMGDVFDKLNPARADSGQFQSTKEPEAEPVEAAPEPVSQEPAPETIEPAKPAIDPPTSWTSEVKAKWAELPPDLQEYIAKREGESHKRITELGETAKHTERLQGLFQQYKAISNHDDPLAEFQNLLYTKSQLLRDPVGSLKQIASDLGVDLGQFATSPTSEPESPAVQVLHQKIAQLERQLGETNHTIKSREQREAEAQQASLDTLVNDFSQGKDYWPDIEKDVVAQIVAIRSVDQTKDAKTVLQEAHDRAVKLNDAVVSKLSEAKRKADAATKATEDKRKADEAKRLASLNVKSNTGKSPVASRKDMFDEMAEIYDRAQRA